MNAKMVDENSNKICRVHVEDVKKLEFGTIKEYIVYFKDLKEYLVIFHMNVCSINKANRFKGLIREFGSHIPDILVFSEAWIKVGVGIPHLSGYRSFRTINSRNRNDGVVVYAKETLNASGGEYSLGQDYAVQINFTYENQPHTLLAAYRTHSSDYKMFLQDLKYFCTNTTNANTYVVIGDLNINILDVEYKKSSKIKPDDISDYKNTLEDAGFVNYINNYTRVQVHPRTGNVTKSCIDHVFGKIANAECIRSAIIKTNFTDHYSQLLMIKSKSVKEVPVAVVPQELPVPLPTPISPSIPPLYSEKPSFFGLFTTSDIWLVLLRVLDLIAILLVIFVFTKHFKFRDQSQSQSDFREANL